MCKPKIKQLKGTPARTCLTFCSCLFSFHGRITLWLNKTNEIATNSVLSDIWLCWWCLQGRSSSVCSTLCDMLAEFLDFHCKCSKRQLEIQLLTTRTVSPVKPEIKKDNSARGRRCPDVLTAPPSPATPLICEGGAPILSPWPMWQLYSNKNRNNEILDFMHFCANANKLTSQCGNVNIPMRSSLTVLCIDHFHLSYSHLAKQVPPRCGYANARSHETFRSWR